MDYVTALRKLIRKSYLELLIQCQTRLQECAGQMGINGTSLGCPIVLDPNGTLESLIYDRVRIGLKSYDSSFYIVRLKKILEWHNAQSAMHYCVDYDRYRKI